MLRVIEPNNLDWHREKVSNVKAKGTAVLVSMQSRGGATLLTAPKAKCVWPSSMCANDSKVLSRRVWGKSI